MPIDEFLALLDSRLHGPRRRRADLIREARDGLEDAAEALRSRGIPAARAERLAVAEFAGTALDDLVRDYRRELIAGQARRIALLLLLLPAGMIMSRLLWWRPPADDSGAAPAFLTMVEVVAWLCYAGGALALAALAALRAHARRGADPRPLARALGTLALLVATAVWSLGTYASTDTLAASPATALTWPPMLAALLLLHGAQATTVWLALRTLHYAAPHPR